MRYLLTGRGQQALCEHLRTQPLIAFDFDGTLAPIAPTPDVVELLPQVRAQLVAVARRMPVIIVSGRGREDAMQRVVGIPVREVYGNHGIEPTHASPELIETVAGWGRTLAARLDGQQGVWIEDKRYSVTIHYRAAPMPGRAQAAAQAAASTLSGVRLIPGKLSINVVPAGAADKGLALLEAQEQQGCATAIYFGDDETDEDVFARCDPERVLGVRIGRQEGSHARFFLRNQAEIEQALQLLRGER
ncbi:MAG: trehalose-phosphatase [Polyangia bacterium]